MSIVIKAKRDGFRRCGIAHPGQRTKYADDFFTEEQLKALIKEPQLILTYEDDEFDQEQGGPNEDFSQSSIPQAPDTAPASQSQAPEAVVTSVAASVVIKVDPHLIGEESGTKAPEASDTDSGVNDDPLIDNKDDAASDDGSESQSPADQQDAAKATVTPPKAKAGKAKAGKE